MAPKPELLLLLLWDLALFAHGVTSLCNVSCSTDYRVSLNCSCSAPVTHSVLLEVKCSDGETEVQGACELRPPASWCLMSPEDLSDVASIGTVCNATARRRGGGVITSGAESSSWALSDVVKPLPPFAVEVKNTKGFFNISWDHDNQELCHTYRVRIRESSGPSEEAVHSLSGEKTHVLVDQKKLKPRVGFTVDVKARMCPGILYEGPWSEWSAAAQWTATGSGVFEGVYFLYMFLPVALVLGVLLLLHFRHLRNKLIPDPAEFFKPLYKSYDGNFKEWVKPAFSERDYLRISGQLPTPSEKQPDVLQWSDEKQQEAQQQEAQQEEQEEEQRSRGDRLLLMLQPLFFQDGGGSTGHVSINTVTLSGEEEEEEEAGPQGGGGGEEEAGYGSEEARVSQNGELRRQENRISDFVPADEPERASLDSFASNGQSEDGYPHVDLDTIDSGFGECSSPGAADAGPFPEYKTSNSNYVKQWMACGAALDSDAVTDT